MNWPHVARENADGKPGILTHAGFYDAYPTNAYYLKRGLWVGMCCDLLAMGHELDKRTLIMGAEWREKPLSLDDRERWIDYVEPYHDLINSPDFKERFIQCLGVQEPVRNELERYEGTRDQRWLMFNGREAIFDTKTGDPPKFAALQTALYDMDGSVNERRRRRYVIPLKVREEATPIEFANGRDYDASRILARAWWIRYGEAYQ